MANKQLQEKLKNYWRNPGTRSPAVSAAAVSGISRLRQYLLRQPAFPDKQRLLPEQRQKRFIKSYPTRKEVRCEKTYRLPCGSFSRNDYISFVLCQTQKRRKPAEPVSDTAGLWRHFVGDDDALHAGFPDPDNRIDIQISLYDLPAFVLFQVIWESVY